MFDRLIESEPDGAEFKNRRSYFMVSSVVVGILFVTAVVISIYAADYGLGNGGFELVEMIAPPEMVTVDPEQPRQQQPASASPSKSDVPTRRTVMSRTDEPTIVPSTISTSQNTQMSRPIGPYQVGKLDSNPGEPGPSGRNTGGPSTEAGNDGISQVTKPAEDKEDTPPPVVKKDPIPKKPISGGVLNGRAIDLPKPAYPATAIAVNASGQVNVQVTVDESGRVISANAIGGHVLLRSAAEQAARNARFTPTYLTGVAVKVTGIITYNFTR
jgi:TonB family protein